MAFAAAAAVIFVAILAVFAASASARPGSPFHPCGTLFITYTVSTSSSSSSSPSPASAAVISGDSIPTPHRSFRIVSIYRIRTPFSSAYSSYSFDDRRPLHIRRPDLPRREAVALGFSSLQERAKDILVVILGLFFAVGVGALTAVTMYLIWSSVPSHYVTSDSDVEEVENDYSNESPKKAGYVKIPAAEPTPAKQGYEVN